MEQEFDPLRAKMHERAIGRWENEGGSRASSTHPEEPPTIIGVVGDAEEVNIRVHLIALENIVVALLAHGPESHLELVREMARYISPRSGTTHHRLTVEAARNMLAIVDRAGSYREKADRGTL